MHAVDPGLSYVNVNVNGNNLLMPFSCLRSFLQKRERMNPHDTLCNAFVGDARPLFHSPCDT